MLLDDNASQHFSFYMYVLCSFYLYCVSWEGYKVRKKSQKGEEVGGRERTQ